uniref:UBZ4-type domain-containing protein n=1 Tax=Strix occidentalis caurina TaxID=311401 RepID=A0A8D0F8J9_STROC
MTAPATSSREEGLPGDLSRLPQSTAPSFHPWGNLCFQTVLPVWCGSCPETDEHKSGVELLLCPMNFPSVSLLNEDAGRTVSGCSPTAADHVSCPLCDQGFPATEIELHAMYCNGIVGEEPVLTRSRREARSKAASGGSSPTSLSIDKCEKCYLCKSLVPLLQYQRHVDSCLQAARQAQGTRRLRRAKDVGRQERGLLRMLELSESKSAGGKLLLCMPGWVRAALSFRSWLSLGYSPSSLWHLPFDVSPVKPSVSSEATDSGVDVEPRAALRLGSQQQTKGCRRRKRKF